MPLTFRGAGADPNVTWRITAAAAISWLGLLVHNVADLPGQTLLSPETLWPSLTIWTLLGFYWFGGKRAATMGLFIWANLNLLGAALTVLPLAVLPFDPEQTLRHYSFHVLYLTTQIPLLTVTRPLNARQS